MTSHWSSDQRIMWLQGWETVIVSHYLSKYGVDRHCVSGDVMGLVSHVISYEHMIKGSCDLMCERPFLIS